MTFPTSRDPTESRRVMRIITRLNVGGPARHALLLHEALQERGFYPELVSGTEAAHEGQLQPPSERYTLIPALKRKTDPLADARALWDLTRLMRARRPQIVHTHTATAGGVGRVAARFAKVPIVVHTFHGHVLSGYPLSSLQVKALAAAERWIARWTDALISVSAAARDELLALEIGHPSQWHVVPVGLDLDELITSTPPAEEARARMGLPLGEPLVGIVGRLAPVKDHELFLDAALEISRSRPEARFVVAGDGELRGALEARARAMLDERVIFLGWVEGLPSLYGALDVVMLTSRNEGTPVALIETGAAGRPVVATSVGGVPEVVREGETGLLVPHGDVEGLAKGVLHLLDHPERRKTMGEAARRWVGARFSAKRLVDDVANLYEELLARKGVAARAR